MPKLSLIPFQSNSFVGFFETKESARNGSRGGSSLAVLPIHRLLPFSSAIIIMEESSSSSNDSKIIISSSMQGSSSFAVSGPTADSFELYVEGKTISLIVISSVHQ